MSALKDAKKASVPSSARDVIVPRSIVLLEKLPKGDTRCGAANMDVKTSLEALALRVLT
jgi:hypothetical protein